MNLNLLAHGNQFLDIANPVAELVEATIFISLLLWSFRCFDRFSNHKLNNHFNKQSQRFYLKNRPKSIRNDYLMPKLVIQKYRLDEN